MSLKPQDLRRVAHVCHEANRALQVTDKRYNGDISPHFSEAPEWIVNSALEGVDKAASGSTPEALHESWAQHKIADGWVYGETKDATKKTHPCLVPYSELPGAERIKDAVFVAIVKAFVDFE